MWQLHTSIEEVARHENLGSSWRLHTTAAEWIGNDIPVEHGSKPAEKRAGPRDAKEAGRLPVLEHGAAQAPAPVVVDAEDGRLVEVRVPNLQFYL